MTEGSWSRTHPPSPAGHRPHHAPVASDPSAGRSGRAAGSSQACPPAAHSTPARTSRPAPACRTRHHRRRASSPPASRRAPRQTPHVRSLIDDLALGLLGGHVGGSPNHHPHLRGRSGQRDRWRLRHARVARIRLKRLPQTEVQHLDSPVLPRLDVGGLQVAVDDAGLVSRF